MSISNTTEHLEALIDANDLQHVLTGLELICAEKADHVRTNWQDKMLAKRWERAAALLGRLARHEVIASL